MTTDDMAQPELVRWLKRVDARLSGIEANMQDNFVSKELYLSNRDADQQALRSVARVSWWSLGVVATLTIGALFAIIGGGA